MTPQEVQERLKLNQLKDKIWNVVPSCATTGEGLFEGLVSRGCLESILNCCLCGLGLALEQCQNCTSKTVKIGHFFARNTISYFLFFFFHQRYHCTLLALLGLGISYCLFVIATWCSDTRALFLPPSSIQRQRGIKTHL